MRYDLLFPKAKLLYSLQHLLHLIIKSLLQQKKSYCLFSMWNKTVETRALRVSQLSFSYSLSNWDLSQSFWRFCYKRQLPIRACSKDLLKHKQCQHQTINPQYLTAIVCYSFQTFHTSLRSHSYFFLSW